MRSVLGIYARETGQGMIFSHDTETLSQQIVQSNVHIDTPRSHPHLTVVK
jgi:stringent starvation protein B